MTMAEDRTGRRIPSRQTILLLTLLGLLLIVYGESSRSASHPLAGGLWQAELRLASLPQHRWSLLLLEDGQWFLTAADLEERWVGAGHWQRRDETLHGHGSLHDGQSGRQDARWSLRTAAPDRLIGEFELASPSQGLRRGEWRLRTTPPSSRALSGRFLHADLELMLHPSGQLEGLALAAGRLGPCPQFAGRLAPASRLGGILHGQVEMQAAAGCRTGSLNPLHDRFKAAMHPLAAVCAGGRPGLALLLSNGATAHRIAPLCLQG